MLLQTSTDLNITFDPLWPASQLSEVYVWCDTSSGPITITLPPISFAGSSYGVKYFIVDKTGNASGNNITVVTSTITETIGGETSVVMSDNFGCLVMTTVETTNWVVLSGDGGGIKEYKQRFLPNLSINPQTIPNPNLYGDVLELGGIFHSPTPAIILNNGNVAGVSYCQAVLYNGVFIFETYDFETEAENNGYWVAFKQSDTDSKLLVKVAELPMTAQFWDNWYGYTLKQTENQVKFLSFTTPSSIGDNLPECYITTLTYNNGVLTAVDSIPNLGTRTFIEIYEDETGITPVEPLFDIRTLESILDDDSYGAANGKEIGWIYYRDAEFSNQNAWVSIGLNIFTGAIRTITPASAIFANVTNFNTAGVDIDNFIREWINHPNGITYSFSDAQPVDNFNNVNGVTALWSPYFENPNQAIYLNSRGYGGSFQFTSGNTSGDAAQIYWDNINYYTFGILGGMFVGSTTMFVQRFNTNTKEIKTWLIPLFETNLNFIQSWANNEGILLIPRGDLTTGEWGPFSYYYITSTKDNYWPLQSNNWYPTNMIYSRSYTMISTLSNNPYAVGIEYDQFNGVNFTDN